MGVIGFVGLDHISLDLADSLVRAGYAVQAFDYQMGRPSMVEFSERFQGTRCASAVDAARDVAAIVVLISNPQQIEDIFFGPDGLLQGLNKNAVIILRAVILPADIQKLEKRLTEECKINSVVDAYVSRGMSEDLSGKIVVVSSGKSGAIARARPVLSAMCEKLFVFDGEIGAGSKVKMVNEVLQAIHLVASVEAISLGVQAKIHPCILYDIISNAAGNSWVFKHHVQQWLRAEHMKHDNLNILVENLATILGLAKSLPFPLPLLGVAHQQLLGCAHNSGDHDKAPLLKVWDRVIGIKVEDAAKEETYDPEALASQVTDRKSVV